MQIMQNRCLHFCLKLDKIHHFSKGDFQTINSLLLEYKVHQRLNVTVFKYGNNVSLYNMKEFFEYILQGRISSRIIYSRLKFLFWKTHME